MFFILIYINKVIATFFILIIADIAQSNSEEVT